MNSELSRSIIKNIILSFIVVILFSTALRVYDTLRYPVEAGIAASQVEDSIVPYALTHELSRNDIVVDLGYIIFFFLLAFVWRHVIVYAFRYVRYTKKE